LPGAGARPLIPRRRGAAANAGAARRIAIIAPALLAVTAALATGCSVPVSPAAQAAGLAVTGPGRSAVPGTFAQAMLTESGPDVVATGELDNAAELLTQRCMQAIHLRYYPHLSPVASRPDTLFYPPYGTLAQRRATGYGIAAAIRAERESLNRALRTREDSYRIHLPAARQASYTRALFGPESGYVRVTEPGGLVVDVPGTGCTARAGQELFGSVTAAALVITGATVLSGMFRNAVQREPGYLRAMHGWARCMSTRGYRYPDPYAAYDSIYAKVHGGGTGPAITRLEDATAVADFQCAGEAGLAAGVGRAERQVLSHLDRHFYGDLLRDVAATEAALRKAGALAPGSMPRGRPRPRPGEAVAGHRDGHRLGRHRFPGPGGRGAAQALQLSLAEQ
jgi:hypothetical protein